MIPVANPIDHPKIPEKPIILVGMMGAGKSCIGRLIAPKLGRIFIDSDHEIERRAAMQVPDIFAQHGEAYFRKQEYSTIAGLLHNPAYLLATGGGAFIAPKTRQLMQSKGLTIWLNADFSTLWDRLAGKKNRPLLNGPDPQMTLKKLLEERIPHYQKAHMMVKSEAIPKDDMANRVMAKILSFTENTSRSHPA